MAGLWYRSGARESLAEIGFSGGVQLRVPLLRSKSPDCSACRHSPPEGGNLTSCLQIN